MEAKFITAALAALLCIFPGKAQEVRTILGNIAADDAEIAMYEELQPAVLIEGKAKDKTLVRKGSRFLGCVIMDPTSIGHELGSIAETKRTFAIKNMKFTVLDNSIDSCRAEIRIYKMSDGKIGKPILRMAVCQDIPVSNDKTRYSIYPEENIILDPGKYFICFVITDYSEATKAQWSGHESWNFKELYENRMNANISFPAYLKNSHERLTTDVLLKEIGFNIGLTVDGIEFR